MTSRPTLLCFSIFRRGMAALALSIILPSGFLSGCSTHKAGAAFLPSQPPAATERPEQVADLLRDIAAALPSYKRDGLARYEGPEIATVEADLRQFGSEDGEAVFPEDAAQIDDDWERLVGLDETLQKEHLI